MRLIPSSTEMPSIPGILMSVMTQSMRMSAAFSIASWPELAVTTRYPSLPSRIEMNSVMLCSSSTTRMCSPVMGLPQAGGVLTAGSGRGQEPCTAQSAFAPGYRAMRGHSVAKFASCDPEGQVGWGGWRRRGGESGGEGGGVRRGGGRGSVQGIEPGHHLGMMGLRKEVHGLEARQTIAGTQDRARVAGEGGQVAGDIKEAPGGEGQNPR